MARRRSGGTVVPAVASIAASRIELSMETMAGVAPMGGMSGLSDVTGEGVMASAGIDAVERQATIAAEARIPPVCLFRNGFPLVNRWKNG
jgi:hypothetical protein